MIIRFIVIALFCFSTLPLNAFEESCVIRNNSFKSGESITFKVFYTLAGLYIGAGEVNFTANLKKHNGRTIYHLVGDGKTYPSYDWFYKVRDRYESYLDSADLKPLRFIRDIYEGGYTKKQDVEFNYKTGSATSEKGVYKIPNCIQDVLSMIYYARNIKYENYKQDDKIPFTLFLDNEIHEAYIRYAGREEIKTKYGKFKAIKFKPLLIPGTIFKGGEVMTVWVSDDQNRIPVRIESPISVGSIKVDMIDFKNLRHPLSGLIKEK